MRQGIAIATEERVVVLAHQPEDVWPVTGSLQRWGGNESNHWCDQEKPFHCVHKLELHMRQPHHPSKKLPGSYVEPGGLVSSFTSKPFFPYPVRSLRRALLGIGGRVLGDGAHVLRALEGARIGAVLLGQAALKLSDGLVFVLLHPGDEVALNDADLTSAVPDERGA